MLRRRLHSAMHSVMWPEGVAQNSAMLFHRLKFTDEQTETEFWYYTRIQRRCRYFRLCEGMKKGSKAEDEIKRAENLW